MKRFQTVAPRPEAVDMPLTELERLIARQRLAARLDRVTWLIAHPEWPTGRASEGMAAEYRHLLYDADEDATVAAFPYPTTPKEALS